MIVVDGDAKFAIEWMLIKSALHWNLQSMMKFETMVDQILAVSAELANLCSGESGSSALTSSAGIQIKDAYALTACLLDTDL